MLQSVAFAVASYRCGFVPRRAVRLAPQTFNVSSFQAIGQRNFSVFISYVPIQTAG